MKTLRWALLITALALAGCSGGGGGGGGGSVPSGGGGGGGGGGSGGGTNVCGGAGLAAGANSRSYVGVAANGEMVNFTIDLAARTWSYAITGSNYGLAGSPARSGTIQVNSTDGTCLMVLGPPSGSASTSNEFLSFYAKSNGLLLAGIREKFGSRETTYPVMAFATDMVQTNAAALDGTYNAAVYSCTLDNTACGVTYGERTISGGKVTGCVTTVRVADCPALNPDSSPNPDYFEATLTPDSGHPGFWFYNSGGQPGSRVVFWGSGGQRIALFAPDVNLPKAAGTVGLTVYGTESAISGATDGTVYATIPGNSGQSQIITFNGTQFSRNGASTNFLADQPWTGLLSAPPSGTNLFGLYEPSGLFAAVEVAERRITLGLKKD